MEHDTLLKMLKDEIVATTACTDVGSVAFLAATACALLGSLPEKVTVEVCPELYKNAVDVGVTGLNERGLEVAAAMGSFLAHHTGDNLEILKYVDQDIAQKARDFRRQGRVQIFCKMDVPDTLYMKATAVNGPDFAYTIIAGDYLNIVETGKNGQALYTGPIINTLRTNGLSHYSLEEIISTAASMEIEQLEFLIEDAQTNKQAAFLALESKDTLLAGQLHRAVRSKAFPYSAIELGRFYTGAATEARMIGLPVPIVSIAGSGNHGIANFLGVAAVAESLGASPQEFARALAISSAVTVYIKGHMNKITHICGCSIAASTGVAAATVYLLGGGYEQMSRAMDMVIGSLLGVLCDGAKETCAYKVSIAVGSAIEFGFYATQGVSIPKSVGVVAGTTEGTVENLGVINNVGMVQAGDCILKMIQKANASAS